MTFDAATITALFLAAGLAGALIAVLPAWRRQMEHAGDLPLWRFLRGNGVSRDALVEEIGTRAVRAAELRCGLCAAQNDCARRLAAEQGEPVSYCANSVLFPGMPDK